MTDTPKIWRDMTPEEKGALLLARYEGKQIEVASPQCDVWFPAKSAWFDDLAYRIKPEPKRETVALAGRMDTPDGWSFFTYQETPYDSHRITFDTIDGKPDPASIKMEEL